MSAYETYTHLMKIITEQYKLRLEVENKFIHEFYEADIPLFKLIYGYNEETKTNNILLSFQLDVAQVDCVLWYSRLWNVYNPIKLTESYFKDDRGETFMGQEADVLHRLKLEQQILSEWGGDKEEAAKYAEKPIQRKRTKKKSFIDKDKAKWEFDQMASGDDDEYH